MKNIQILTALLLLLFVSCKDPELEKQDAAVNQKSIEAITESQENNSKSDTSYILLSDLKITPLQTIENEVYLLTAFDMLDKKTMVYIGNFSNKNVVRFFDLNANKIASEIGLEELLLDVYAPNDTCYILAEKSLFVIYNNQIVRTFPHGINPVFTFDRLVALGDQLFVSMSDGSAWRVGHSSIEKLDKLKLNDNPVWIQKTSPYTFSIDIAKDKTINYTSEQMTGAMTVLGEWDYDLICIVEKIINQQPMEVERLLISSKDDFAGALQTVRRQPYAFLKNDLRLHGNLVYHLILENEQVTLITERIDK